MMSKVILSASVFVLMLFFGGASSTKSPEYEVVFKYNIDSTCRSYNKWSMHIDSLNNKLLDRLKTNKKHD